MTIDEMKDAIVEGLTIELQSDPDFSPEVLNEKVDNAIREVKLLRRYASAGYSTERIEKDIVSYYSNIRGLALYDYNQAGVEGQSSSQENSVLRTYVNRNRMFNGIVPLSKVL